MMMHAAWLALALFQADGFDELRELRQGIRQKRAEAAARAVLAHEALDRGEYDRAVEHHRRSRALEAEGAGLKGREERLIPTLVADLVRDLMHDDVAVRERAGRKLVQVGPGAVRPLEAVAKGDDLEARGRAQDLLRRLADSGVDAEGRLRQWATGARASSEYQTDSWSARQATGKPNTSQGGDAVTAWASSSADSDEEWLELTYDQAVRRVARPLARPGPDSRGPRLVRRARGPVVLDPRNPGDDRQRRGLRLERDRRGRAHRRAG
jgi:hypothetical protein